MTHVPVVHFAFGLVLRANTAIPGLVALQDGPAADVEVWLGSMPAWLGEGSWDASRFLHIDFADGTNFLIDRAGTRIWATWPDTLSLEDTATYLLGPILGFVLRLRGTTALHASAIAVGDRAVGFTGPAGAGKSTTAAALARLGYPVLTDDLLALQDEGTTFLAQPAYPRVRLWPSSATSLYGSAGALPRLTPTWDKLYLDLVENGRFHAHPLPVGSIYIFGARSADPAAPFIEAIAPVAGLLTLVANIYAHPLDRSQSSMRARDFERLGRLVRGVSLKRVVPHVDPARIPRLCEVILADLETSAAAVPASTLV
jgi:energy-coupling factor transporter ATP-binding protein EcfA2